MYSEKTSIIIAGAVALLSILAVGAGSITGNIAVNAMSDSGGAINIAIAMVIVAVFFIAAISVLKVLVPEGMYHQ